MRQVRIDEVGKRYGRLTVLRSAEKLGRDNRLLWVCKCDCGAEKEIVGKSLRNGTTRSCGCLMVQLRKKRYMKYSTQNKLDDVDEDILR